jgi:4-amino-4-deoxy-L-arabinose transferase-like glycosyltransferase
VIFPSYLLKFPSRRETMNYQVGYFCTKNFRACMCFVLLIAAINVLYRLGSTAVNSSDEARYGVSAFEMLENNEYVVTTYAGEREYWNMKPPMGYWLIAASFHLFGPTLFALRLPSALAFILCVWLTMNLVKEHYGRRQAILAGIILSSASGLLSNHGARSGDLDAVLTCLLTLAVVLAARIDKLSWNLSAISLCFGAGFLIKSFAIIPQLVAFFIWMIWCGKWKPVSRLKISVCLMIFSSMLNWWVIARYQADHSHAFALQMIKEDLLDRSTRSIDDNNPHWYFYIGAIFDRFAPWMEIIILAAVVSAVSWRSTKIWMLRPANRLLLLWSMVPFLLFTCSQTRHHWYMDPLYPPLSALSAVAVIELLRRSTTWRNGSLAFLIALVLACEARVINHAIRRERMPPTQEFLASLHRWKYRNNESIYTVCRLWHSERFILQVLNGFDVHPVDASRKLISLRPGSLLLIEKGTIAFTPVLEHGGTVLAEEAGFVLVRAL